MTHRKKIKQRSLRHMNQHTNHLSVITNRCIVLFIILSIQSCTNIPDTLFTSLSPDQTGISFINQINDNDSSVNILNFEYIYNGGGVAIGDLNNDGLPDIVFTANRGPNAVYINRGNMQFADASTSSGVGLQKRWSSGVTLADINLDGKLDIYVSATGHERTKNTSNMLFINQGNDEAGHPIFEEQAQQYGIADNSHSTQSVFFDYDNDQDLDLLVIANVMPDDRAPSRYRKKVVDGSSNTDDHLYENKWSEELNHPVFTEVSQQAGILIEGFSLGVNISDINQDGWKDIYITNDYLSNDLFYINNQDGTFTDKAAELFKHNSFSAMGNDVIDLDNDGDSEIIAVDMLPEDNYRRKTMLPPNQYSAYYNNDRFGFVYQFVRNTLQVNNGVAPLLSGHSMFSDVAFMSGVSSTDWSWAPVIADFDNDMDRDMIITNGFPKDVTDRDFMDYSLDVRRYAEEEFLLAKIPAAKLLNYAYENRGELQFKKVSADWGIDTESFSNGAAYGDLDLDGDLDYVVNNINDPAFVFENNSKAEHNWIRIKLAGPAQNPTGIGAVVTVYSAGISQVMEHNPVRGYLSHHEAICHFGLGPNNSVDSITVQWSIDKKSIVRPSQVNQVIEINYAEARKFTNISAAPVPVLLQDISDELGIDYRHFEQDIIDFNTQPLLLHKLSQYGPGISVADINDDGMDDFYVSGSADQKGVFFIQLESGEFSKEERLIYASPEQIKAEELGSLFFDADNDGDPDLYIVHGGNEFKADSDFYQDQLYINDNGFFKPIANALPISRSSGLAVKAADYDKDGDLDLFVGGRLVPGQYPLASKSVILRNDSQAGQLLFTDVTADIAPDLAGVGMVTDALWTDYDNDKDKDLMVVTELGPILFFENSGESFQKRIVQNELGLWTSIAPGDYDNDGDIDYIVGNFGNNLPAKITEQHPLRVYFKDFDNNGIRDLITTCYFPDESGQLREYTYHGSTDLAKQYNSIKKKFQYKKEYAVATMQDVFSKEDLEDCKVLMANNLNTSILLNEGNGDFIIKSLPAQVQRAPVYGMQSLDLDQDGNLDILIVGNDYGVEVSAGRMDALDGLVGFGHGDGSFTFKQAAETGFYVQGDAKALVSLYHRQKNRLIYIVSQNQDSLRIFESPVQGIYQAISPTVSQATITHQNGKTRLQEFYFGNSFLSQSSRGVLMTDSIVSINLSN